MLLSFQRDFIENVQNAKVLQDINFDNFFDNNKMGRLLISLKDIREIYSPNNLIMNFDSSKPLFKYFQYNGLYYLDNNNYQELKKGRIRQGFDITVCLDTNYCNYIHKFVNGKSFAYLGERLSREVPYILTQLQDYGVNYDFFMYYTESSKTIELGSSWDDQKEGFKNNMISLELFRNNGNISKEVAEIKAREQFNFFYNDEKMEDIRRLILILEILILKLVCIKNTSSKDKVEDFLVFMCDEMHIFFDREFIFAHDYLENNCNNTRNHILRKLVVNEKLDRGLIAEYVNNIAWDFALPRMYEKFILSYHNDKPLIPFFLTNDEGLKNVLQLYMSKAIISFDNSNKVITIPNDEILEKKSKVISNSIYEKYFTREAMEKRMNNAINEKGSLKFDILYAEILEECTELLVNKATH